MRKDLILTYNSNFTFDEWKVWRMKNGIGASEAGAVAGVAKYLPAQKLFYIKIGQQHERKLVSYQAFTGKVQEELVATQFEHYEDDFIKMMENFESGKKVSKVQRVNAFIQNPDYMHLFASIDRKILSVGLYEGRENAPLECKTMDQFVGMQYEAGFPTEHIFQLTQQMGVLGSSYGVLAIQTNNREFDVYEFEFEKDVFDMYLENSLVFWNNVLKGRELMMYKFNADLEMNVKRSEEIMHEIMMLEPPAENTLSYQDFLKEKFKYATKGSTRRATPEETERAILMMKYKQELKEAEERFLLQESTLKNAMGGIEELTFGDKGFVTWKNDVRGFRRFNTRLNF